MKLKEIYRVLVFNQPHWLKPYVRFNTRTHTHKIEIEKNVDKDGKALYKLMNNAVYGKTMKNLRNRIDVRLISNKKYYLKWTSKPTHMSQKIFDNDLVEICKSKLTLKLKKPASVGMYMLDLSKVYMHEFHYDYIKNKYGNNSKLLFTDADSLIY